MLAAIAALLAASVAHADVRPLLRQQGFYGPINGRETIKYVGDIPEGRNDYQIYLYNGVFRPVPEGVDHGVNRLLVILNGSIFVGAYDSSSASDCKVRAHEVICNTEYPGVVKFTKQGPPYEILFDGEIDQIAFGNKLKAYRCNEHPCGRLKK